MKKWWDSLLVMIGLSEPEDEFESYPQSARNEEWFPDRPSEKSDVDDELTLRRRMRKSSLVSIPGGNRGSKINVYQPVLYDEVQEIADQLKNGRPVLLNLEYADRENAGKIVNFLSGTIYALNGDMHRVGQGILLFTPEQVEVQLPLNGIRLETRHS